MLLPCYQNPGFARGRFGPASSSIAGNGLSTGLNVRAQPVAASTATRLPGWEDVPTIAETVPGFEFVGWFGVVAPSGTPAEAVQRFARETGSILRDPEVVQRLHDLGTYTVESAQTPEGFADYMRTERMYWEKLLKEIGVEPE
jgi:tripartite-type tricarboxylate transporter receptor subunit TctC